jgi:signal transduction histidine kinase
VAGASSLLEFDQNYNEFFELLAGGVASAVADAEAYQEESAALAELDHAKTAFFSNVSHEFRTPLTLLLGPLEDLLAKKKDAADWQQLDLIHRNALRLLRLVNTLLDFSRIEAGRAQAVYEPTGVARQTSYHASVFRSAIERAGMQLNIDCPPLPEPVYVDRDMWEKIVLNLVSNAFKYTLEGEITASVRARGGKAVLRVKDTGTGIPKISSRGCSPVLQGEGSAGAGPMKARDRSGVVEGTRQAAFRHGIRGKRGGKGHYFHGRDPSGNRTPAG